MRAPITDKHLLEMMWERFPEIMKRGTEQPAQQEPVAIAYFEKITGRIVPPDDTHRRKFPMCYRPLVFGDTSPQPAQHEPLTDDEIRAASLQAGMQEHYMGFHSGFIRFTRAIEAAHNIKEQP